MVETVSLSDSVSTEADQLQWSDAEALLAMTMDRMREHLAADPGAADLLADHNHVRELVNVLFSEVFRQNGDVRPAGSG